MQRITYSIQLWFLCHPFNQIRNFPGDVVHTQLAFLRHLTEGKEAVRHSRNNLHPDINPCVMELAGEHDILIKTRIKVRGNDDCPWKLLQCVRISQQGGQVHVIDGLGHPQFIIDGSWTSAQIIRVLIGIETSQQYPEHEQRVYQ